VLRKPWSEREYSLEGRGGRGARLCFAMMRDNGIVKPFPPLQRAMQITKEALEADGHKVIDWIPHRHLEIYTNAETIFVADGGEDYRRQCEKSGEPLIKSMRPSGMENDLPLVEPFVQTLVGAPYPRTAFQLWELHKQKRHLRRSHLEHWQATVNQTGTGRPVDAIISPATAYPAPPHGLNTDSFYTTLANALDYSACCFPVTTVDIELDLPADAHAFYNHEDEALYRMYKPELFKYAPVGLQLMGKSQEEEAVIAMTEIVDDSLKRYREKQLKT